ncbi:hypothetical protein [Hyphobacterium sp.]|uniref:hypothetical protein n=1 Tax=Hyphobacterium sp. TaxID=2004662 RepID=UPI003B515FC1
MRLLALFLTFSVSTAATMATEEPAYESVRRDGAIEFRGGRSAENLSGYPGELEAWLAAQGYEAVGDPEYAFFSPPWVPTPLRRNEIMIEVAAAH